MKYYLVHISTEWRIKIFRFFFCELPLAHLKIQTPLFNLPRWPARSIRHEATNQDPRSPLLLDIVFLEKKHLPDSNLAAMPLLSCRRRPQVSSPLTPLWPSAVASSLSLSSLVTLATLLCHHPKPLPALRPPRISQSDLANVPQRSRATSSRCCGTSWFCPVRVRKQRRPGDPAAQFLPQTSRRTEEFRITGSSLDRYQDEANCSGESRWEAAPAALSRIIRQRHRLDCSAFQIAYLWRHPPSPSIAVSPSTSDHDLVCNGNALHLLHRSDKLANDCTMYCRECKSASGFGHSGTWSQPVSLDRCHLLSAGKKNVAGSCYF
jgi:hypothetical protein